MTGATLTVERPVPYALADRPFLIILIGCGGTGSHTALKLAQLAAHCRARRGPPLDLLLIDGDAVEARNVEGRQLFSPAEVGRNKSTVLAGRFNAVFGLDIEAIPRMATGDLLHRVLHPAASERNVIVVGAVDSAAARRAIHDTLDARQALYGYPLAFTWVDGGNHEHSGQVLVGNTRLRQRLRRAIALGGLCTALPAPSLVEPGLLASERPAAGHGATAGDGPAGRDCAAAVVANRQSLLVNSWMADIIAMYATELVLERKITTFRTDVDLRSKTVRSTPITAGNIAAALKQARPPTKERTDHGTR